MSSSTEAGFKVTDLMITLTVAVALAGTAIPAYQTVRARAREASVRANMRTLQMALEDFALQNEAIYPTDSTSTLGNGLTLRDLCVSGEYPANPFTQAPSVVQINADPAPRSPGELAVHPARLDGYRVIANGANGDVLPFMITTLR